MRLLAAIAVAALAASFASRAQACDCAVPTMEQAYAKADRVVLGEVTATRWASDRVEGLAGRARLRVEEVFKGAYADEILVGIEPICGLYLQPGDRFVLFIGKDRLAKLCAGSFPVFSAETLAAKGVPERDQRWYRLGVEHNIGYLRARKPPRTWWPAR